MRWADGQISELKIHSRLGGNLRLRTYSPLPEMKEFKTKTARGENPNAFYRQALIKKPLKHTAKVLPQLSLANTYLVDIATHAGQDYVWRIND
jgi:alpha-L-fucosidase 2